MYGARVWRNKWTPHVNRIFFFESRINIYDITELRTGITVSDKPEVSVRRSMDLRINCVYPPRSPIPPLIPGAIGNPNMRKFPIYFPYFATEEDKPGLISAGRNSGKMFSRSRADVVGNMRNILFACKHYCEMFVDLKSAKYGTKNMFMGICARVQAQRAIGR